MDWIPIPGARLADWIAMIGSAVVYFIFAIAVFITLCIFVRFTRMRFLGNVIVVLLLVAGLAGYWVVFVDLDSATYAYAVKQAGRPLAYDEAALKFEANMRARSIFIQQPWVELSRTGLDVLPVVAVALAAMLVRRPSDSDSSVATTRPAPSA